MTKRVIAVVTGTRAEFGLLESVMRAIASHPGLTLRTIVAGSHWVNGTWHDVKRAGFVIDAKVLMQKRGATGRAADVEAVARGVGGFGRAFARMRPDAVLVLGDRVEAFAAATAAGIGGVMLAHVHGGDRAEGVADEAMRHAISKLAHVHFAATAMSRKRLIRMGELARWVFDVGSPAADMLRGVERAADGPDVIVMQHPIGAPDRDERRWMAATLKAAGAAGGKRLVLAPNNDPGSAGLRTALSGVDFVEHLPRERFVSLLAGARVIVGNSSAGLIEAAVLRVPCVNVGPRQSGREKPANVVDCDYGEAAVAAAIAKALKLDLRRARHPYGDGHAGQRIADHLASIEIDARFTRKRNAY